MRRVGAAPLTVTAPPSEDDWRQRAACSTPQADLFFPDSTVGTGPAKAICQLCPVAEQCGQWALDTRQEFGVFGGLDERERRALLRRNGAAPKPRGPGRPAAPCGTRKAWERHIRNGEPIDDACAAARYSKPLEHADAA